MFIESKDRRFQVSFLAKQSCRSQTDPGKAGLRANAFISRFSLLLDSDGDGALVYAGADPAIRGTGAPGFAGRNAYDLAEEQGMMALCTEIAARQRSAS